MKTVKKKRAAPQRRSKKELPIPSASPPASPAAGWLLKASALFLSFLLGAIGTSSAVLSFQPRITITPKHMLIPKQPGSTSWEVKNEGALPVTNLGEICRYVSPEIVVADSGDRIYGMGSDENNPPSILMPGEAYSFTCQPKVDSRHIVIDVVIGYRVVYLPPYLERASRFRTGVSCAKEDDGSPNWVQEPAPSLGSPDWDKPKRR